MIFASQDAVALLRLDDLYVDSFQVQDVKTLTGDHLRYAFHLRCATARIPRHVGRLVGRGARSALASSTSLTSSCVVLTPL